MTDSGIVVVLDLGSSRVVALAARDAPLGDAPLGGDRGGIEILARAERANVGVRRGVVNDLESTASAAHAALRELEGVLGREIAGVTLGVGGPHVHGANGQAERTLVPRGRTITHSDAAEIVSLSRQVALPPDRELFQTLPREFRIDGERDILRPVGMSGSRIEVITYLVSGASAHLQNLERAVSRHGRRVDGMVLSPLAAGIATLNQDEIESGAAVVDIGAGKTDVAVFINGALVYSAGIAMGAGLVSADLGKLLKTSPEEAERLKLDHAAALAAVIDPQETVLVRQIGGEARPMSRGMLCEIVESRMREIATTVGQHLELSGYMSLLPGGVALVGGGARLPGTVELFSQTLRGVRVRRGGGNPEHTVAIGLAQFALRGQERPPSPRRGADLMGRARSLIFRGR